MLRELLRAWRSRDMLNRMVDEFSAILDDAEAMFASACAVLFEGRPPAEVHDDLYARDRRVNETEWAIRKQLVEHLSVNPGPHAPACLALMSVVKDADRLADYSKNLFEVERLAPGGFGTDRHVEAFVEVARDIRETFARTRRAFAEDDGDLSYALLEHEIEIEKRLNGLLPELAAASLACRQAVAYTLTARHLKRLSAHLGNIASAVVMPIDKIDSFDEKWHRED